MTSHEKRTRPDGAVGSASPPARESPGDGKNERSSSPYRVRRRDMNAYVPETAPPLPYDENPPLPTEEAPPLPPKGGRFRQEGVTYVPHCNGWGWYTDQNTGAFCYHNEFTNQWQRKNPMDPANHDASYDRFALNS